jgi:hypothetical protein
LRAKISMRYHLPAARSIGMPSRTTTFRVRLAVLALVNGGSTESTTLHLLLNLYSRRLTIDASPVGHHPLRVALAINVAPEAALVVALLVKHHPRYQSASQGHTRVRFTR